MTPTEICNDFNQQYSASIKTAYREQDDKNQIYLCDLMAISQNIFWNEQTLRFILQPIILDHVEPEMFTWSKLYFRNPHYGYAGDGTFGWCANTIKSNAHSSVTLMIAFC